MSVKAVRHIGIVVSDMETSLSFYRDLLGMEVWWDETAEEPDIEPVTGIKGAKIHMVKLMASDGVSIELLQYLNHPKPVPPLSNANDIGCNHVALQVDDLDGLYERAKAQGIRFNAKPKGEKTKMTYCRDPEGAYVELVEIPSS